MCFLFDYTLEPETYNIKEKNKLNFKNFESKLARISEIQNEDSEIEEDNKEDEEIEFDLIHDLKNIRYILREENDFKEMFFIMSEAVKTSSILPKSGTYFKKLVENYKNIVGGKNSEAYKNQLEFFNESHEHKYINQDEMLAENEEVEGENGFIYSEGYQNFDGFENNNFIGEGYNFAGGNLDHLEKDQYRTVNSDFYFDYVSKQVEVIKKVSQKLSFKQISGEKISK